jgi:hypothetical protein
MAVAFLDFEQPIAELEAKIEELKHVTSESEVNIQEEIGRLQAKSRQLTTSIFANLTPWQITQLGIRTAPIPSIMSGRSAVNLTSCTAIGCMPTTWRSSAAWPASKAVP